MAVSFFFAPFLFPVWREWKNGGGRDFTEYYLIGLIDAEVIPKISLHLLIGS